MTTISYPMVDLAKTRFALSPLGHLVHGVHDSACSRGSSLRRAWWHTARRNVPSAAEDLVARINADPSSTPTFLAPPLAGYGHTEPSFDTELQALEAAHPDLNGTVDALRKLYKACLADDWAQISRELHADLGGRAATLLAEGPAAALASLHDGLAWSDGQLIIPGPDVLDFDATGGLVAMPCAFGQARLHPILTPGRVPILIYSIAPTPMRPISMLRDTLSSLIGPGRARSLRELAKSPASTSQLARRLNVSVPAASKSATALRNSGLIQSFREGQKVVHHITPVATALLAANPAPATRLPAPRASGENLRTVRTYWQYRRRHEDVKTFSVDWNTADPFLLGESHGNGEAIDRVSLRSGHRRWSHELSLPIGRQQRSAAQ